MRLPPIIPDAIESGELLETLREPAGRLLCKLFALVFGKVSRKLIHINESALHTMNESKLGGSGKHAHWLKAERLKTFIDMVGQVIFGKANKSSGLHDRITGGLGRDDFAVVSRFELNQVALLFIRPLQNAL